MKKLFFAATLAIVAIGGAQATIYYGATRSYDCSKTTFLCKTIGEPLWLDQANVGNGNPDVPVPSNTFKLEKYN